MGAIVSLKYTCELLVDRMRESRFVILFHYLYPHVCLYRYYAYYYNLTRASAGFRKVNADESPDWFSVVLHLGQWSKMIRVVARIVL